MEATPNRQQLRREIAKKIKNHEHATAIFIILCQVFYLGFYCSCLAFELMYFSPSDNVKGFF